MVIPLPLIGYGMMIANSSLRSSLAICHLISNARSWDYVVQGGSNLHSHMFYTVIFAPPPGGGQNAAMFREKRRASLSIT